MFNPNLSGAKVLWENSNPTSNFSAQTLNLPDNDCDMVEIFYYMHTNQLQISSIKVPLGQIGILTSIFQFSNHGFIGSRAVSFTDHRTIQFYDATTIVVTDAFNRTAPTTWIIPIKIVGYKTGLF